MREDFCYNLKFRTPQGVLFVSQLPCIPENEKSIDFEKYIVYNITERGETMCSVNQLQLITKEVAKLSADILKDKLDSVILYGSYARGDFDEESDIDMMILADVPVAECWQYTQTIADKMTDMELLYNIIISVHVVSSAVFNQYMNDLPFYRNVDREGIRIAV